MRRVRNRQNDQDKVTLILFPSSDLIRTLKDFGFRAAFSDTTDSFLLILHLRLNHVHKQISKSKEVIHDLSLICAKKFVTDLLSLLALDERYLRSVGGNKRWLKGMIGLAGPYDWLPYFSERDKQIFGPLSQYPASQSINFVDGDEPRLLLMYGNKDKTVKIRNIDNLAAAVRSKQGKVKTIFYPRLGHIGIVGALSIPLRSRAPVLEDVATFIYGNPAASMN